MSKTDITPYVDRINSILYRSDDAGGAKVLATIVILFGLTEEEFLDLDLNGMGPEQEEYFYRAVAEFEAAGINVDG